MFKIEEVFKNKWYYILADYDEFEKLYQKFIDKGYICNHISECHILLQVREGYEYEMFASFYKVLDS